jgi:hypothetical protein
MTTAETLDTEPLNSEHPITVNKLIGHFVLKVSTLVSHMHMFATKRPNRIFSAPAVALLSLDAAL